MFRPPRLLAPQIAPTAANIPAGRPRLLRPSRTCVVAFARIGYTIRLTTANWRDEDFHLARFSALSAAPYLCESFPGCLGPCHGGFAECTCLFLPPRHRPSPVHYRGRLPACTRRNDFMTDRFFETAAISLCSGQVCWPPRSFLPLRLIAAGQPRLLRPSRTCVVASACIGYANHPPRQLVVWGLTPHEIHSLVGCSSEIAIFRHPWLPL
jgi:hypothetical protein